MRTPIAVFLALACGLSAAAAAAAAAEPEMHGMGHGKMAPAKGGDAALIASAMSAAPAAIARHATIVEMSAKGAMRVVRKGANGFTCMPDDPTTPGPDPMCGDENAMQWAMAMTAHKAPAAGKVGFLYMLAGGTDASNTDPYAAKPTGQNHWIKTGPHVMIVGDKEMLTHYPANPDPDTSQPYVMWAGTPYAHLMIPVK